jgi:hypothetical protein
MGARKSTTDLRGALHRSLPAFGPSEGLASIREMAGPRQRDKGADVCFDLSFTCDRWFITLFACNFCKMTQPELLNLIVSRIRFVAPAGAECTQLIDRHGVRGWPDT